MDCTSLYRSFQDKDDTFIESRVEWYKKMRVKLKSISGESKRREKIKGIRITVTQKGTGTIYNILIILNFLFQFLQIRKGSMRLCDFLTSKYSQRSLFWQGEERFIAYVKILSNKENKITLQTFNKGIKKYMAN